MAGTMQEAPGCKLLSVGGQLEKWAVGSMHAEVPSVKCAKVKTSVLCLFFGKLLRTYICLAKCRLRSPVACLRLLLKVEF